MKKNYIYAISTVFIWSTLATVAKLLLNDIPNLQTLAISGAFAFLFLLIVNICNGSIKLMAEYSFKQYAIMAGLGFVGLFMYSALYYYGLSQLSAQEACILNYLWPIMIVLFSCIFLREKLTAMKIIAMLCSFAGIVILSVGSGFVFTAGSVTGYISCIVAAVCYGLFSVLNKKANLNQNITMMIIWLTVTVCSFRSFFTGNWVPIGGVQWLGLAWLGIAINAAAYLLWSLALNKSKNTAVIANLAYLVPFLSLVVSAIVLKEQIEWRHIVSLIFIIGGILLQNIKFNKDKKTD